MIFRILNDIFITFFERKYVVIYYSHLPLNFLLYQNRNIDLYKNICKKCIDISFEIWYNKFVMNTNVDRL